MSTLDELKTALASLAADGFKLTRVQKTAADWSMLPRDMYVTSVSRDAEGIVWTATMASVPMAVAPEVRYTHAADGFVLVPREATKEMVRVGTDARWRSAIRDADNVREIYAAMLAAAPKPGETA